MINPLQAREQIESLATTIVTIARNKRSARLSRADLFDLVKRDCPPEHRAYWSGPYCSSGTVVGLLQTAGTETTELGWWGGPVAGDARRVGDLRRLVEAENVMFWSRWEDEHWRLVDTRWLTAHADIYRLLTEPRDGGARCGFCATVENQMVNELKPLDAHGYVDPCMKRLSGTLVHDRCRPYLLAWGEIAAKYSGTLEAATADIEAGRRSRYDKVKKAQRLEAPEAQAHG